MSTNVCLPDERATSVVCYLNSGSLEEFFTSLENAFYMYIVPDRSATTLLPFIRDNIIY